MDEDYVDWDQSYYDSSYDYADRIDDLRDEIKQLNKELINEKFLQSKYPVLKEIADQYWSTRRLVTGEE